MSDKEIIDSKSLFDESDSNLSCISPIKVFITQKKKNHESIFRMRCVKRYASICNCIKSEHTEKISSKNQNEQKYDVINVEKKKKFVEVKKKPEHIQKKIISESSTPSRADSKYAIHTSDFKKIRLSSLFKAEANTRSFLENIQAYTSKHKPKATQKYSQKKFFSKVNRIASHTPELLSFNKIPKLYIHMSLMNK
ncbi:hypothetical protein SteCoe_18 [Stentor coeruleus]|uniref:Uncharacterized protein n=1 Tax=Stentor coeruleus TaxID=5963 RepID=A0A1R2D4X6_9CILI|nr:hypothetical protein SteCoe_18 [Stentor coeruleus]